MASAPPIAREAGNITSLYPAGTLCPSTPSKATKERTHAQTAAEREPALQWLCDSGILGD